MRLNNLDFFSFSFILACANLTVVPISFQRLIKLLFSSPAIPLFVALEQELQVLASVVHLSHAIVLFMENSIIVERVDCAILGRILLSQSLHQSKYTLRVAEAL